MEAFVVSDREEESRAKKSSRSFCDLLSNIDQVDDVKVLLLLLFSCLYQNLKTTTNHRGMIDRHRSLQWKIQLPKTDAIHWAWVPRLYRLRGPWKLYCLLYFAIHQLLISLTRANCHFHSRHWYLCRLSLCLEAALGEQQPLLSSSDLTQLFSVLTEGWNRTGHSSGHNDGSCPPVLGHEARPCGAYRPRPELQKNLQSQSIYFFVDHVQPLPSRAKDLHSTF